MVAPLLLDMIYSKRSMLYCTWHLRNLRDITDCIITYVPEHLQTSSVPQTSQLKEYFWQKAGQIAQSGLQAGVNDLILEMSHVHIYWACRSGEQRSSLPDTALLDRRHCLRVEALARPPRGDQPEGALPRPGHRQPARTTDRAAAASEEPASTAVRLENLNTLINS